MMIINAALARGGIKGASLNFFITFLKTVAVIIYKLAMSLMKVRVGS
jgi:hypothetical protein